MATLNYSSCKRKFRKPSFPRNRKFPPAREWRAIAFLNEAGINQRFPMLLIGANKKDTVSQIGVFLELALFLYWWAVLGTNLQLNLLIYKVVVLQQVKLRHVFRHVFEKYPPVLPVFNHWQKSRHGAGFLCAPACAPRFAHQFALLG